MRKNWPWALWAVGLALVYLLPVYSGKFGRKLIGDSDTAWTAIIVSGLILMCVSYIIAMLRFFRNIECHGDKLIFKSPLRTEEKPVSNLEYILEVGKLLCRFRFRFKGGERIDVYPSREGFHKISEIVTKIIEVNPSIVIERI